MQGSQDTIKYQLLFFLQSCYIVFWCLGKLNVLNKNTDEATHSVKQVLVSNGNQCFLTTLIEFLQPHWSEFWSRWRVVHVAFSGFVIFLNDLLIAIQYTTYILTYVYISLPVIFFDIMKPVIDLISFPSVNRCCKQLHSYLVTRNRQLCVYQISWLTN